jgi:hypothetical protein
MARTVNDSHDLNAGFNFAVKNQVRADGKVAEIRMEIWSGRPHAWIFREAHASCVDLVKKSVGGRRIVFCDVYRDLDQVFFGTGCPRELGQSSSLQLSFGKGPV